jgi:hypothetical protein
MEFKEAEISAADMIASLLNVIAYLISPILLIWSVNTLFECGISVTFKTWLAGLVLIMLVRFHLRSSGGSYEPDYYEDDYEDDDDEFYYEDEEYETPEERKARLKRKLIVYPDSKNRKTPPDQS